MEFALAVPGVAPLLNMGVASLVDAGSLQGLNKIVPVAAATTVTVAQSDAVFKVSGGTYTITLPALATAAGTRYKFYFSAAVTVVTILCADGPHIAGGVAAGSAVNAGSAGANSLICTTMVIGDQIELFCDGTIWAFSGFVHTSTELTYT